MGDLKIHLVLSTNKSYRLAVMEGHPYSTYAPATLMRLASLVPAELQASVRITDLVREPVPAALYDADLVGISAITCGAPFAYALADDLRKRGKTVVLGGAHPTVMPQEAGLHADSVVAGYAEKTWPRLLTDWRAGRLKPLYSDFSNPFDVHLPPPDRRLFKGMGYFYTRVLESSRGCPNHCGFCTVSSLNGGKVFFRPVDETLSEIRGLAGNNVLFLDSNFTDDLESRKPLWHALREAGITWFAAGTLGFAGNGEAVRLAALCGCRGMLVGFESLNSASLEASEKPFNKPEQYAGAVKRLHDNGIQVLGCFVFGFDDDEPDVFERTVKLAQDAHIDMVRYAIATPFPGTRLFAELARQGRIIEDDWECYDTEHVVFRPRRMTPEQLYEGHRFAYKETYRLINIAHRICERFSLLSFFGNLGFRNLAYTFCRGHDRQATVKNSLQGETI